MSVDQRKILVDDLKEGMYVSRLDRPWIETPFPLQGFYVKDLMELDQLRRYCREVTVDISCKACSGSTNWRSSACKGYWSIGYFKHSSRQG